MAVPLSISTNVNGLGVSLAWGTSASNTIGTLISEPGPGATLHLAGTPASWTVANTAGNMSGSSFVFTNEPSSWSAITSTQKFTIYYKDATGAQQYAYSCEMTPSGTFPARTWASTSTAYGGTSAAPTAQSSTATTSMYELVIAPETTDAVTAVPGAGSSPALTQMFVGSNRTGLIVLKDASTGEQAFLVGPYSGTVWAGSGANPITALASTGATNAVFSTADTSTVAPIYVGYYTA